MNIVIRPHAATVGATASHYSPRQLLNEARSAAKGRGKLVHWWLEVHADAAAVCQLRVQIKRPDGLGDIINVAL